MKELGQTCRQVFLIFLFLSVLTPVAALAGAPEYAESFRPLPEAAVNPDNPLNPAKVELGKFLFFDPRLSKSGFISCNSCHNLATGGVDNLPTSIGHKWQLGPRNAPTVLNAALHFVQFWDGRAGDVEEQAKGPVLNPGEMAATEGLVLERIRTMPQYKEMFGKAFGGEKDPINYDNVANAIAAFERTLLTPSRFDVYLEGDEKSLSKKEKKGLELFVKKGCVGCHNGVGVGGGSFQRFDYGTDEGRFDVTHKEGDRMIFRVPGLRNVALTYPYFHDGSVWQLEEAVRIMGEKQLGVKLTEEERGSIVAFLNSLTGTMPEIVLPMLPPSTKDTPQPDVD